MTDHQFRALDSQNLKDLSHPMLLFSQNELGCNLVWVGGVSNLYF